MAEHPPAQTDPQQTPGFEARDIPAEARCELILSSDFDVVSWSALNDYYQRRTGEGLLHWDLNARQLSQLSSPLVGLIIGMNARVLARGGRFRLTALKSSKIIERLKEDKLDRIMEIQESD